MAKPICQRCESVAAVKDEKYCRRCRKAVLRELAKSGFLEDPPPRIGTFSDQRGRSATTPNSVDMGTDGDDW